MTLIYFIKYAFDGNFSLASLETMSKLRTMKIDTQL